MPFNPIHQPNARLILNWVVSYKSLPIVGDDYNRANQQLTLPVDPQYDARYIPVIQSTSGSAEYIPTQPGQLFQYREFMTQNGAQVLPRYVISLYPSAGREHQINLMLTALQEKLGGEEVETRRRLKEYLNAEYRSDPELSRTRDIERVERTSLEYRLATKRVQGNQAVVVVSTPTHSLSMRAVIPDIAKGHEEEYLQFLNGKLVYKPNKDNDINRKEFRIRDLTNPLSGVFDISECGDSAKYLTIATGFKTSVALANKNKMELWLVPLFVLQKDLRAQEFWNVLRPNQEKQRITPFSILISWGGWSDKMWFIAAYVAQNQFDNFKCMLTTSESHTQAFLGPFWESPQNYDHPDGQKIYQVYMSALANLNFAT